MDVKIEISQAARREGHKGSVYKLLIIKDGEMLSASGDGMVVKWPEAAGIEGSKSRDASAVARMGVNIFALEQYGSILALAGLKGGLRLLNLASGAEEHIVGPAEISVYDLFRLDEVLYTARGDGSLAVVSAENGTPPAIFSITDKAIRKIAPEPILKQKGTGRLALPSSDNSIHLFDINSKKVVQKLDGHERSVFCAAWSPDGRYLVSGSMDAHIRIWDAEEDLRCIKIIPAHLLTVNDLVFHPGGEWMASAGRDRTVKIWSVPEFELLKVIEKPKYPAHAFSVNCLVWDNHNQILWSGGDDKMILGWKVG